MTDEHRLASLVLLLRLESGSPALASELERHDYELLCFVGQIARHYAVSTARGSVPAAPADYAYLRLATRIVFSRYASLDPTDGRTHDDDCDDGDGFNPQREDAECCRGINDRVWEYERCLLSSLLVALSARVSVDMDELDVELAWAAHGLLVTLSARNRQGQRQSLLSRVRKEAVDTIVARRKRHGRLSSTDAIDREPPHNAKNSNDVSLMIRTIHSILDRNSPSGIKRGSEEHHNELNLQYDMLLVSCVQSCLQTCSMTDTADKDCLLPWKQHTLFEMIHWSQRNEALSREVYWLLLKYLRFCVFSLGDVNQSPEKRNIGQFYSSCLVQDTEHGFSVTDGVEVFSSAIRSILFYGLVVLGNTGPTQNTTNSATASDTNRASQLPDVISPNLMRGDIFSLTWELWQCFGSEWLLVPPNQASGSLSKWWWFPLGNERDSMLGPTWPICALVRLAAGEFRLSLGRWGSIVEDGKDHPTELISEICCCGRIVIEAVQLMTTIAEQEDALVDKWLPAAILHIRHSLEDALNSSVQHLTILLEDTFPEPPSTSAANRLTQHISSAQVSRFRKSLDAPRGQEQDEVGRMCCAVLGSIAAELEVEYLLSTGAGIRSSATDDNTAAPSFAYALRGGILFCNALGERQLRNGGCDHLAAQIKTPPEYHEPLIHLLPCIISLVSNCRVGNELPKGNKLQLAFSTICEDDCLVVAVSGLLGRAFRQLDDSTVGGQLSLMDDERVSVVKSCALIISLVCSPDRKYPSQQHTAFFCELCLLLQRWKNCLSTCDWPSQASRTNIAQSLDQVSRCLLIVESQRDA